MTLAGRSPGCLPFCQGGLHEMDCPNLNAENGLQPTPDNTPPHGLSWRDGLDALDALLNDSAQLGTDYQNFVRVSAVRDIVAAVRRWEDDTDESIRQALWEDAVVDGWEPPDTPIPSVERTTDE